MGKIRVNTDALEQQKQQMEQISKMLHSVSSDISSVNRNLSWKIASRSQIKGMLKNYASYTNTLEQKNRSLSKVLQTASQQYQRTERKLENMEVAEAKAEAGKHEQKTEEKSGIQKFWEWIKSLFVKEKRKGDYEIDGIVFDDDGSYGGNQGAPQAQYGEEREALYDIVRKYYPSWDENQIKDYLKKLNSEGCGYVAIVNTIFQHFEGREEEFERKFGFPMYGENGDLNYNRLIVDFYSATDNHNRGWLFQDKINNNEDSSATKGYGTTPYSQKYRAELYLKDKGIDVKVEIRKKVSVDNYQKLAEEGSVIINYHYGNLYDEKGKVYQYIDGGHSMTVTGVTEDGRYIVSSWGQKLYIDPNESLSENGKQTSYDFVYYKYK